MTLFKAITTPSPFCDNAHQVVFSTVSDRTNFFDQRLDKHRVLLIVMTKLFKDLQDDARSSVNLDSLAHQRLTTFYLAAEEYLVSEDFTPVTEMLACMV